MDNGSKIRAFSCSQQQGKMMISLLLASYIATHNGYAKRPLNHGQVRRRAHQIVQMLKKEDPRVLRSVMYYMKWVPRIEYKKNNCKKTKNEDPVLDILMDNAGIPKDAR